MSNILAIVITYYPKENDLRKDIDSFKDCVDKILIWENTPQKEANDFRFIQCEKVEYCGLGENVGMPTALNYAWKYAVKHGYNYLLSMDQDSCFVDFQAYLMSIKSSGRMTDCIWGPCINNCNVDSDYVERRAVITSGMLVSINVLNTVGGWPKTFKIDCVDYDFCYNARSHGIKSYWVKAGILKQQYGERKIVKTWKSQQLSIATYRANRIYSIVRNGIIMRRKYKYFPIKMYLRKWVLDLSKQIFLYERNGKIVKFWAVARGVVAGVFTKYK